MGTIPEVKNIVVHCSDSGFGCRKVITGWHLQHGWDDVGYHYIIMNGRPFSTKDYLASLDGSTECGRPPTISGAHVKGMNTKSLGVCLIGKHEFSYAQMDALLRLLRELMARYGLPASAVIGHYETPTGSQQGKTCPNFDMDALRGRLDQA
jgi:N-acetyl-anhydromuramyl-L-alanine amidase AmpD